MIHSNFVINWRARAVRAHNKGELLWEKHFSARTSVAPRCWFSTEEWAQLVSYVAVRVATQRAKCRLGRKLGSYTKCLNKNEQWALSHKRLRFLNDVELQIISLKPWRNGNASFKKNLNGGQTNVEWSNELASCSQLVKKHFIAIIPKPNSQLTKLQSGLVAQCKTRRRLEGQKAFVGAFD